MLVFAIAGSASLWSYVRFRRGADSPAQRRVARFAIKTGIRHLPVMLVVGAAFWYSILLVALASFLPEGALRNVASGAGLLLVLATMVLLLVWTYRPPRRLLPQWYVDELAQAPAPPGTTRTRLASSVLLVVAALFLVGAYAAYRLDAPPWVWIATAAAGALALAGYVMRD
jgi:hypothetical protein